LKLNSPSHRPPGYAGKIEHYLPLVVEDLDRVIVKAQGSLAYNTLCLSDSKLVDLPNVLVEFAEDIHNDIGIWESLERYNIEFFGTPLALILQPNEDMGKEAINKHRIQYLLWVLYSELQPQLLISPTHRDLEKLSVVIATFLENRFKDIPKGSSINAFLSGPNSFGWEVKKKLI